MANVDLSPQSPATVTEALAYLRDQGSMVDDNDILRMHINAVVALMLRVMARDRMIWVDDDELSEYRSGDGSSYLYLKNAPVRKVAKVTLEPMASGPTELTGPTEPALTNDDMWFNPVSGQMALKSRVFPEGPSTVLIEYEAGYYKQDSPSSGNPADPEIMGLKLICLDAVAAKMARWKNQKHGIASESKGESSISYSETDFNDTAMHELRRYRRTMFA